MDDMHTVLARFFVEQFEAMKEGYVDAQKQNRAYERQLDEARASIERLKQELADLERMNAGLTLLVQDYEALKAAVLAPAPEDVAPAQGNNGRSWLNREEREALFTDEQAPASGDHPEVAAKLAALFLRTAGPMECPFCDHQSAGKRGRHAHLSARHPDELAIYERDKGKIAA